MNNILILTDKCYNIFGDDMKKYIFNDVEYELIKDYRNGFDSSEVINKITEYFEPYDYILGDWSYGKLRLKGFCEKGNKLFKPLNDIDLVGQYIQDNCAHECRHFILKKSKE